MVKINCRDLLHRPMDDLWGIEGVYDNENRQKIIVVFDDGEVETTWQETIYSVYTWEFHRRYPLTPMLKSHHVNTILGGKRLGSKTHLELLGSVMFTTYDVYQDKVEDQRKLLDDLRKLTYQLTNHMYNDLTYRLGSYVVSLDIIDFINIDSNPAVSKANSEVESNQDSIDSCYKTIQHELLTSPALANNPIALAVKSKLADTNQVNQCVGPRGYLTDNDSNIFPNAILRSYTKGIRKFHDSLIESRMASKALIFSKAPLQEAEYFSRRLQLMCQVVQRLHWGDCGSASYLHWKVRDRELDENGQVVFGGDLHQIVGSTYLDDDNKLKYVKADDRHLIGRTLKLRSALGCAHPDPYGICATCFGELSLSVPEHTNIGHMCGTSMTQKSSQSVLSVKHVDGSSVVEGIVLGPHDKKYLKVGSDDNSYLLSENLKGKSVKLIIEASRASNITDILEIANVEDLSISRVSELLELGFLIEGKGGVEQTALPVNIGRRLASMTYPMLRYLRKNRWVVDERGNYVVDMKDWDWSQPILSLPLKHINMSDHSKDIANMLEASVDEMHHRDKAVSPAALLAELYDLVNSKLSVNLQVLAVVVYGSMIRSADEDDYALPKPWTKNGLGVMTQSMLKRSLAATMAFQGHRDAILSPVSFTLMNRPDHPMDGLLVPEQVYKS